MSTMGCLCGGIIRDNRVPCPTEAWILRDQDQEAFYHRVSQDVAGFYAAVHAGDRAKWLAENFSMGYPTDVSDEDVVHDILSSRSNAVMLSIAECDTCGRLWVQREPAGNSYLSYAPDAPGYGAALRVRIPND